jgi:hypothetical protein
MVREGTAFLLDALAGDKPEEGALQTKLLEINLVTNPQVCCRQSCASSAAKLRSALSRLQESQHPVHQTAADQHGNQQSCAVRQHTRP